MFPIIIEGKNSRQGMICIIEKHPDEQFIVISDDRIPYADITNVITLSRFPPSLLFSENLHIIWDKQKDIDENLAESIERCHKLSIVKRYHSEPNIDLLLTLSSCVEFSLVDIKDKIVVRV